MGDLVTPLKRGNYEPSDERDKLFGKVLMVTMVLPGEEGLCRAGVIEGEQWSWFSDDLRLVCAAQPEHSKTKPRKSLKCGDLVMWNGHIGVVYDVDKDEEDGYWVTSLKGDGGRWYAPYDEMLKVSNIPKKVKRLLQSAGGVK